MSQILNIAIVSDVHTSTHHVAWLLEETDFKDDDEDEVPTKIRAVRWSKPITSVDFPRIRDDPEDWEVDTTMNEKSLGAITKSINLQEGRYRIVELVPY